VKQGEIDGFRERHAESGRTERCGWLDDRYGVPWHTVPSDLGKPMADSDPARVERFTEAMLEMSKLQLAAFRRAHGG